MTPAAFSLRRIAISAVAPSLLFRLGEGAILPVIPLTALALRALVPMAALMEALSGFGSLVSNIPASLITMHRGARRTIVAGAMWCALARQSYLAAVVPIAYQASAMSTLGGSSTQVWASAGSELASWQVLERSRRAGWARSKG